MVLKRAIDDRCRDLTYSSFNLTHVDVTEREDPLVGAASSLI